MLYEYDDMLLPLHCKQCGELEYYGEMRWLSGKCVCRDCYKKEYELQYGKPYEWDDLDGPRPNVN